MASRGRRSLLGWGVVLVLIGAAYFLLWNPEGRAPRPELDMRWAGRQLYPVPIAFSPDSAWFYFVDRDFVHCHNLRGGPSDKVWFPNQSGVELAVTHKGQVLVAPGIDDTLYVIDLASDEEARLLTKFKDSTIRGLAASPTDDTVAVLLRYYKKINEHTSTFETALTTFPLSRPSDRRTLAVGVPHSARPKFSRDGRLLACATGDDTIRVWRVADGSEVAAIPTEERLRVGIAIAGDGSRVCFGGHAQLLVVWSVPEGRKVEEWTVPAQVTDADIHPDGSLVAGCSHTSFLLFGFRKGTIWVRNPDGRTRWFRATDGHIDHVAVSPDGRFLAVSGGRDGDKRLRLWRWDAIFD